MCEKERIYTRDRMVFGVGINDADYILQIVKPDHSARYGNGKYKQKLIWRCPYYQSWKSMLERCYSEKFHQRQPTYKGCVVSEEWKLFSNFRKWMIGQDWEGMHLEKDLLVFGNKVYSPETCVFVTGQVNGFLVESSKRRGDLPLGVVYKKSTGKFLSQCSNPLTGTSEHLGYFYCEFEAHKAWLAKKLEHAYALAAIQTDQRVAIALIERYENYQSDRLMED